MFIDVKHRTNWTTPAIYEFMYAQRRRNVTHTKKPDSPSLGATCTIDKNDIFRVN
jgi:hypothetical protein